MRIRPGRNLLFLLAALACWSLVSFVWPAAGWLTVPVLMAALALCIVEYRALRAALSTIALVREAPALVGRERPFQISLQLTNPTADEWAADVRDEVPAAANPKLWIAHAQLPSAGTRSKISQRFTIPVRGRYQFGPTWVRLRGRFGMLEAQRSIEQTSNVQVVPQSLISSEELAKDSADEVRLLDKLKNSRHRGTGTEFESLEEYRHGDDPRRIDWRATARTRRPVVRRYQIERHRDIMVLVDCGRLMGADAGAGTKLDCAVDAALRLIRVALGGGDRCGLAMFDNEVLGYMSPIAGSKAFSTVVEALYDLKSRWRETDFSPVFARLQSRQTKRSLVIVISDVIDVETSGRYRTSLTMLARRHIVMFAALRTPLLRDYLDAPVEEMLDGFKKAVVIRTLREREQAIHSLRRAGVHVLDVEPQELTAPLINQFIELRQSNLL